MMYPKTEGAPETAFVLCGDTPTQGETIGCATQIKYKTRMYERGNECITL
jgi:hypothetical protein